MILDRSPRSPTHARLPRTLLAGVLVAFLAVIAAPAARASFAVPEPRVTASEWIKVSNNPLRWTDPTGLTRLGRLGEYLLGGMVGGWAVGAAATSYVFEHILGISAGVGIASAGYATIQGGDVLDAAQAGAAGFVGTATAIQLGALGVGGASLAAAQIVRSVRDARCIRVPHGFSGPRQFREFGERLGDLLEGIGVRDARGIVQGSAASGQSFSRGVPFDGTSDIDLAIVSPGLMARARAAGIQLRSRGTRTGPNPLNELDPMREELSRLLGGRRVDVMLFDSVEAANARGPGIRVPR